MKVGFGLRVAAKELNPSEIKQKSLRTRPVSVWAVNSITQLLKEAPTPLSRFEIAFHRSGEFIMKALPLIFAGVGLGLAAYFVLNQPGPQFANGNDKIEDAAGKTAFWGSKQRVKGTGGNLVGKLKEGVVRAASERSARRRGRSGSSRGIRPGYSRSGRSCGRRCHPRT
jgi:hypothetical protein